MTLDRLDQNIDRFYRDQKLDPAVLDRLKQTIDEARTPHLPDRTESRRRTFFAAAIAAMIVVAVGSMLLLMQSEPQKELALELSTQAALVHNQRLDMEFEPRGYGELRRSMPKLGFTPVRPARFQGKDMQIIGARYGLLEGQPAAQITLLDPDGNICTLYQLRPVGTLAGIRSESRQIDGLEVDLWHEKGLLMVLARPAA